MAIRYAVASGNWSNTATWDGGTLPGAGDTVYLNNKLVDIDQVVDLAYAGTAIPASEMVPGAMYEIVTVGTSLWYAAGSRYSTVGSQFVATCQLPGTGTCRRAGCIATTALSSPSIASGGGLTVAGSPREISASLWFGTTAGVSQHVTMTTALTLNGSVYKDAVSGCVIGFSVGANQLTINGSIRAAYSTTTPAIGIIGLAGASITVNGDVETASAGTSTATIDATYYSVTINGSIIPHPGTGSNGHGLRCSSGTVALITGDVAVGPTSSANACAISVGSSSSVTVLGNVTGGTGGSACIYMSAAGTVVVGGDVIGSVGPGILLGPGATLEVDGDVYGGSAAPGVSIPTPNASTLVVLHGDVYGGSGAPGVVARPDYAIGLSVINGNEYDHANGFSAVSLTRRKLGTEIGSVHRVAITGAGSFVERRVQADPAPEFVIAGHTYAGGDLVGSFDVPDPSLVAKGVPVGATVGTATFYGDVPAAAEVAAAVRAELAPELAMLDAPLAAVPSQVRAELTPELDRVANCATVASVGAALAAFEAS